RCPPGVDRRSVGAAAEELAARALTRNGYAVVARNVRLRDGELDLVCRDGGSFVFCEVKARRPSAFGVALEALTARKRERLERLALSYLAMVGRRDAPYRIVLVAVDLDANGSGERIHVVPCG
ncbi:MAG TPA: YraN family protein, partial [Candidatus Dormibacteraeota bacterium]|nr:YraN family protein [Candidatus Dormibacteraeota bacterium]